MSLFGSITAVAKKATGSVSDFRKVLDLKPSLSSLVLPPQVSMGLKAANLIGGANGVQIPSEDDIRAYAQGKLDKALGGLYSDTSKVVNTVESSLTEVIELNGKLVKVKQQALVQALKGDRTAYNVLNSVDWLLTLAVFINILS